ncbi:hypothetical protein BL250_04670 [Erwinia sp. OLTSP20]|uniref:histidine-type phosphatase n=1 Tax=unclassified Erwinia TaxID=2622719 RepID=UPI000C18CE5F|nr:MULTISPECIES: histidine-type phosphatase [unclassified Erwinia]PIJ52261.1 hypothetical protein BV501_00645 [Erwinia sp. OAMSP11]PIJ75696.1 hypothetical protein BK416_00875 [Erwinia sp. OLSSP12]PIJ83657.1 hypothetical protein BLD46_09345 [Erwinia sp. OLMTSP26]PIJ84268.1 hypothetical protein BLD47_02690 [Erwinia sp. OLCASP19]PIJ88733.1 hypothetical protein BLD49_01000 [Erwinia sp. OLMDSP33]
MHTATGAGLIGLLIAGAASADATSHWQLEKVVEVVRHGVRAPVPWDRRAIEAATGRPWPRWRVADGELTRHGWRAVWLKAQPEGQYYRQHHLISPGCPTTQDVYIYASPRQRTRATATAFSEVAFPGCQLKIHYQHDGNDPLFLTGTQHIALDGKKTTLAVLRAMGGNIQTAQQRWQPAINQLARALCRPAHPCPLASSRWQLRLNPDGRVSVPALDHQAAAAETLRLAWSEGWPAAEVGFGHLRRADDLLPLLTLNSVKYRYTNDIPYLARRLGSRLLAQIIRALSTDAPAEVGRRWLVLVAHDNNIAWLRTLLDFHWQQAGYPPGDIPPGASLVFERWRNTLSGKRYLRIRFRAQRLEQIRHLRPLASAGDLLQSEYRAPGCQQTDIGILCPLNASLKTFSARLDNTILQPFHWPVP